MKRHSSGRKKSRPTHFDSASTYCQEQASLQIYRKSEVNGNNLNERRREYRRIVQGHPEFIDYLRARLADHQSGAEALKQFAPSHTRGVRFQPAPANAREACVIVLLYPRDTEWYLPLVVRTNQSTHHRGQVALPGGGCEPGESLATTALRELHEEIGVPSACVELVGRLSSFYVPVSGYHVHPWLGWTPAAPSFRPNPAEVQELLEVPIAPILNLSTLGCESREILGQISDVPYFTVGRHKVWGATCIVLGELAMLCRFAG